MPNQVKTNCPKCGRPVEFDAAQSSGKIQCGHCNAALSINKPPGGGASAAAPKAKVSSTASLIGAQTKELPKQIGQCEIRGILGQGSFGTVYLGYHPFLDKQLAVKILRAEVLDSQQAIERFQREAKILADMKHANILRVYDAGKHGQDYYIASEFIAGQDLADAIPDDGMPAVRAAGFIVQMLDALAYAHSRAVVHRDIKPRNARLDQNGEIHVMDFGLAGWAMFDADDADETSSKEKLGLTMAGQKLGTPAYMSPEQAKGETASVGPASDIYSVGVVLYELLTGHYPFDARDPFAMCNAHVYVKPEPPSTRRADVPSELDAICLKALEKRPADRFTAGVRPFAARARGILAGRPTVVASIFEDDPTAAEVFIPGRSSERYQAIDQQCPQKDRRGICRWQSRREGNYGGAQAGRDARPTSFVQESSNRIFHRRPYACACDWHDRVRRGAARQVERRRRLLQSSQGCEKSLDPLALKGGKSPCTRS